MVTRTDRILIAGAGPVGLSAAAYLTAPMFGQGETVRIGGLAIIVIAGMLAFAVAGRLLGAYDATEVRRLLRR